MNTKAMNEGEGAMKEAAVTLEDASRILREATKVKSQAEKVSEIMQMRGQMMQKVAQVNPSGRAAFFTPFDMVCQFHVLMDTWNSITRVPTGEDVERRMKLINEEVMVELFPLLEDLRTGAKAHTRENLSELLDHLIDSVYVLLGTAAEFGLPFDEGFIIVHSANMSKFANGVQKNEYGKLIKPEGWKAPNDALNELIQRWWAEASLTNSAEHKGQKDKMQEEREGNDAHLPQKSQ